MQAPDPARLSISERYLTVETGERRRRFSLRSRPELLATARGFLALAEGDSTALRESFEVELFTAAEAGAAGVWELLLTPGDPRVAEQVDSVVIRGRGDRVRSIHTNLSNGDWQRLDLLVDD